MATFLLYLVRQLPEKYFVFVSVPQDVMWWAMHKLGVEEWVVKVARLCTHVQEAKGQWYT